ncbi:MAG: putative isomerase YddE [Candidatus Izimaplasma bacterium HR2]|nr:MAG: putative isomerase YddE [Candidatus Izimaplasma bacterium HR2]
MDLTVYKLSSFPKEDYGGNEAGVVLDADSLKDKEMLKIAKEVGFSETAFVSNSNVADYKVRFFTPANEVSLCGHATIATFNLLRDKEIISPGIYTQETKAGILKLDVKEDIVFMEQNSPVYGQVIEAIEFNNCFYNDDYINHELPIVILSTGMREIFLPINSVKKLNNLTPNFEEIIKLSKKYDVIGIHVFSVTKDKADAYGRNFAPIVGINEESATGTSNGALGCYLNKYVNPSKSEFILRQGYSMNKPSEIITKLQIQNRMINTVWVGGTAKII